MSVTRLGLFPRLALILTLCAAGVVPAHSSQDLSGNVTRRLMSLDDVKAGLSFAANIVGEIAGAIGTAMVEAFRLAMRLLRALIIMVKTIVQLMCNIVGEIMDKGSCYLPLLEESISQHLLIEEILETLDHRPNIT